MGRGRTWATRGLLAVTTLFMASAAYAQSCADYIDIPNMTLTATITPFDKKLYETQQVLGGKVVSFGFSTRPANEVRNSITFEASGKMKWNNFPPNPPLPQTVLGIRVGLVNNLVAFGGGVGYVKEPRCNETLLQDMPLPSLSLLRTATPASTPYSAYVDTSPQKGDSWKLTGGATPSTDTLWPVTNVVGLSNANKTDAYTKYRLYVTCSFVGSHVDTEKNTRTALAEYNWGVNYFSQVFVTPSFHTEVDQGAGLWKDTIPLKGGQRGPVKFDGPPADATHRGLWWLGHIIPLPIWYQLFRCGHISSTYTDMSTLGG